MSIPVAIHKTRSGTRTERQAIGITDLAADAVAGRVSARRGDSVDQRSANQQ